MRQKYKVFLNERYVLLTNEWPKKLEKSKNFLALHSKDKSAVIRAFDSFQSNKSIVKLIIVHNDTGELWDTFKSLFEIIPAAGGLVFNENNECLMIFRKGMWDLPKGKLEKKEKIKECALREVEEECGITHITLEDKITVTYHIYTVKGTPRLKPSHWFLMRVDGSPKLTPQAEEDIDKAKWVTMKKASELLDEAFPSIKEVFKAYGRKV
jgi:8-oxo-dGTP pyrophosphatase MutT (NUDIX family)